MRRWLGRCAAKGHFAAGDSLFFPSAAISITNYGFGSRSTAMEMAAQAGIEYYDGFRLFILF